MRAWSKTAEDRCHSFTRDDFDTDAEYEEALAECQCDDCRVDGA